MPEFCEMKIKESGAFGEDFFLMASDLSTCLNKMQLFYVEVMVQCKGIKFRHWAYKLLTLYIYMLMYWSAPAYVSCWLKFSFLYYANWGNYHIRDQCREHVPFKSSLNLRESVSPHNKKCEEKLAENWSTWL